MPTSWTGDYTTVSNWRTAIVTSEPVDSDNLTAALIATPDETLANFIAFAQKYCVIMGSPTGGSANSMQLALPGDGTDILAHVDWTHAQSAAFHPLDHDDLTTGPSVITYDEISPNSGRVLVFNAYYSAGDWHQTNTGFPSLKMTLGSGATGNWQLAYWPAGGGTWADSAWLQSVNWNPLDAGVAALTLQNIGPAHVDQSGITIASASDTYPLVNLLSGGNANGLKITTSGTGNAISITGSGTGGVLDATVQNTTFSAFSITANGNAIDVSTSGVDTPTIQANNTKGGASSHGLFAVVTGSGSAVVGNASGSGSAGQSNGGSFGATGSGAGVRATANGTGIAAAWGVGSNGITGVLGQTDSGTGVVGDGGTSGAAFQELPQSFYPATPQLGQGIYYNGPNSGTTPNGDTITQTGVFAVYGGSPTPHWKSILVGNI